VARTKGSSNQFLRSAFGPSAVAPHASIAQSAGTLYRQRARRDAGRGRCRDRQGFGSGFIRIGKRTDA
jgi:hypothetical protein